MKTFLALLGVYLVIVGVAEIWQIIIRRRD